MLKTEDGKVPVLNLKSYFTDHSTLRIPSWQRDYSWIASDEEQVGTLIEDLQTFFQEQGSSEYLMGSVILCDSSSSNQHLVIDGQQRSLTLTIFIMAAIKHLTNQTLLNVNDAAHTALIHDLHSCVSSGPIGIRFSSRLVMNNPAADAVIRRIYQWSQLEDSAGDDILVGANAKTKSEANLIEVAQYIYKRFASGTVFSNADFIAAMQKIVNGVKLVVLTLDSQSEALRVYDRINNRGMVLSSADLIKNIIFMNVDDAEFEQVSDAWLEMAKELTGIAKARLQDPKFLLRMLAGIEKGQKITYDGLVDYWTKKIEEDNLDPISFANDLPVKSSALKNLAKNQMMYPAGEIQEWQEPTPVLTTQLHIPYELNSVQHYSVLLAALHFEKAETISKLSRQVVARSLLYIFAQERTQSFETIIPSWANAISQMSKSSDPDDLDEIYLTKAFQVENPIHILESAMRNNMASWSWENASEKKKIRALFALLNLELDLHFNAPELMRTRRKPGELTGWELDHIMPKSLVADKWVHRMGNLTLLAPNENTWANNTPPINKISENLYSNSDVFLTKICDDLAKRNPLERENILEVLGEAGVSINYKIDTNWDEESTAARTQFLIDWACYALIGRYT